MRISRLPGAVTALSVALPGAAGPQPGAGQLRRLSVAAMAFAFAMTSIEPARATTVLNIGDLLMDGFFADQNWRHEIFPCEFLGYYRLQWNLNHREWSSPEPPPYSLLAPPLSWDPPPSADPPSNSSDAANGGGGISPLVNPSSSGSSGLYTDGGGSPPFVDPSSDPPDFDNGGADRTLAVPEPSTWAMLLLGFAGLGYAAFRRSKRPKGLIAANETGALSDPRLRTPA